ncbi:hypothetical protein TcCL_NonESM08215 [Trypanosoma cruzi]|nr:hypothetical protein TcCL_NonESM08215 [Trypanosoma cruzi]
MALSHSLSRGHHRSSSRTTKKRSKGGEVVCETAVLLSLSPGVGVPPVVAFVASTDSFGLASLFSFCFSSRVPAPSTAGSLFGMPSSVLLSASLLAKLPFSVGGSGFVSAWPSDVSFCKLVVMGGNALSL